MNKSMGKINLILGPMFSGKSSKLCEEIRKFQAISNKVFCINHISDVRYGENAIYTHYGEKIPAHTTDKLMNLIDKINDEKLIAINEGQFFPDLTEFCLIMRNKGCDIVICALDGDYKQEMFPEIIKLLPKCDSYTKVYAKCKICCDGTDAPFTKRITNEKEQIVIGVHNYIPVCWNCLKK